MPNLISNTRILLESTFATAWGTTTPVKYQNVEWKQPSGIWCAVFMATGRSELISLGTSKLERTPGLFTLQIHVPKGIGTGAAATLADTFANIFRFKQLRRGTTTVSCQNAFIGNEQETATGWMTNSRVGFTTEDFF